jgi:hypothetical protein
MKMWGGMTAVCCLAVLAAGVPDAQSSIQVRPLTPQPAVQKTAVVEKSVGKLDSATGKACVLMNMACGQTVTGQLSGDDCALDDGSFADFWEFQGTSGQRVTVTMTSTAVDAYLFLLDPSDTVVGEDDDSAGGTNARISNVTLGANGNFAIVANSLTSNETGSYQVTLACQGGGGGGALAAPSNLQATAISSSEVQLTWADNSTTETGFLIEVRQGASGTFTQVGTVGANINGAIVNGLTSGTSYGFRVRATNGTTNSAYSNVATAIPQASDGYFTDPEFPGFRFRVRIIDPSGQTFQGRREGACIEDTVCVSGQLAGRTEVFLRIIGPRPNGFLWPTIVRFTPSRVEVDIQQTSTGVTKSYVLPAVGTNDDNLSGLQDREGFLP